jgi:hypothetical protein
MRIMWEKGSEHQGQPWEAVLFRLRCNQKRGEADSKGGY